VRFFFQAVFGVAGGLSSVHLDSGLSMKVFGGGRGEGRERICFHFSQWEGLMCLASIPFQFGGLEGFFNHCSLFPNVFPWCSL